MSEVLKEIGALPEQTEKDVEYNILNTPELREKYIHLTDQLISSLAGDEHSEPTDVAIFLDKSARPVAWLMQELWPIAEPDKPMPQINFLNIDRNQWRPYIGTKTEKFFDYEKLPREMYQSLRSIFVERLPEKDEDIAEVEDTPTFLDGKRVAVIDEVKASGDTIEMASGMLSRAIPDAQFAEFYWMTPEVVTVKRQGRRNAELPVWYSEETNLGRGVGERDWRRSQASKSMRQRLGGWFLSNRLIKPDSLSDQLRAEIKQIGKDVRERKLLYLPSAKRDVDNFEEITRRINGLSIEELAALRRARTRN